MRATSSPATRALCAFAALFVVLLSRPAGAGGASDDPYAKQLQAKVATVVAVKAVFSMVAGPFFLAGAASRQSVSNASGLVNRRNGCAVTRTQKRAIVLPRLNLARLRRHE